MIIYELRELKSKHAIYLSAMLEKTMPLDLPAYLAARRIFLAHRAAFDVEELAKHAGKWVAWSPDGTRIAASAQSPELLVSILEANGEDPVLCVVEGIPDDDASLMSTDDSAAWGLVIASGINNGSLSAFQARKKSDATRIVVSTNRNRDWLAVGLVGATLLLLVACWINFIIPESKISRTKSNVKALEIAVRAFEARCGSYPERLGDMVSYEGGLSLVEEPMLTDPWGQPYIYSPNVLHPKTGIPQIFSYGPPGQDSPIRNWELDANNP
jgi:hypothetical protein